MKLTDDLRAIKRQDPAARNYLEVILLYSGFHAVFFYRLAHLFYICKLKFIARLLSQLAKFLTGVEIHPGARIDGGLFIDHGSGVVIGETTEIGKNCTLYQGVTLGGTGKDKGKRHPTLGDNVLVGSGAKILGPFKVGDNCKIAANAVLLTETPPDSTAVGVPARIVKRSGIKVEQLDHVRIPDPVSQEICKLQGIIHNLEKRIKSLEAEICDKVRTADN